MRVFSHSGGAQRRIHRRFRTSPDPVLLETTALDTSNASRRPLKVCVVSSEFRGPFRNGGIGTAYSNLAELLCDAGHDVTLLCTDAPPVPGDPIEHWVRRYRERGIRLVLLPQSRTPTSSISASLSISYRVYLWLRDHDPFDVIHFPERLGHGFYALAAQRQGLILQTTVTVVGLHGPSSWTRAANDQLIRSEAELEIDFLERRSAEMGDIVWSPSQYMLDWARSQGWDVPEDAFVRPLVVRGSPVDSPGPEQLHGVQEVVFFGRQEVRKGILLFLAAIDCLARARETSSHPKLIVTILGNPTEINGQDSCSIVNERARAWPFELRMIPDFDRDQALAYLSAAGRLAVMPSLDENYPNAVLECLAGRVPFLVGRVGGIPEQIAEDDLERVSIEPRAELLAERLSRCASFRAFSG